MNRSEIASPELGAVEVLGINRASFILRGAVAAGAVYGASAVGPYLKSARPGRQLGRGHPELRAHAGVSGDRVYQVKGASVGLSGEAKTLAKSLGEEDAEHVAALTKAISGAGAKPVAQAEVRLPGH